MSHGPVRECWQVWALAGWTQAWTRRPEAIFTDASRDPESDQDQEH